MQAPKMCRLAHRCGSVRRLTIRTREPPMATTPKIGIILSTTREGRFADRVAAWLAPLAPAGPPPPHADRPPRRPAVAPENRQPRWLHLRHRRVQPLRPRGSQERHRPRL